MKETETVLISLCENLADDPIVLMLYSLVTSLHKKKQHIPYHSSNITIGLTVKVQPFVVFQDFYSFREQQFF